MQSNKYVIGDILADLGFDSFNDFITTIVGFKNNLIAPLAVFFGATLSLFISKNIWSNPGEVYFLAILTSIDLFTGVWKAIKFKSDPIKGFRSRRISRTVGKIITYTLVLYMSFNLDKNMHTAFFWMPYSCLCLFYTTEAWSIIENFGEIGYLDKGFITTIKEKLNVSNLLKKSDNPETQDDIKSKKKKISK